MMSDREVIIDREVKRAFEEAIKNIELISLPFRNPKYDLKKTVDNDIDFILGAVIDQIINNSVDFLRDKNITRLTPEENERFNVYIFSQAGKLKDEIKKILGT
jgi:hypothetical protein